MKFVSLETHDEDKTFVTWGTLVFRNGDRWWGVYYTNDSADYFEGDGLSVDDEFTVMLTCTTSSEEITNTPVHELFGDDSTDTILDIFPEPEDRVGAAYEEFVAHEMARTYESGWLSVPVKCVGVEALIDEILKWSGDADTTELRALLESKVNDNRGWRYAV